MSTQPKIAIQGLRVRYGAHPALKGVTLDVQPGEILAIIGPSHSGKTTLLKCLNRMIDFSPSARVEGSVLLDGVDVFRMRDPTELRRRVGFVAPLPVGLPLSIYDNVAFAPRMAGLRDKRDLDERVERCLRQAALWDEVKDRIGDLGTRLSGGQQQRLTIARALSHDPEVLCLDEFSMGARQRCEEGSASEGVACGVLSAILAERRAHGRHPRDSRRRPRGTGGADAAPADAPGVPLGATHEVQQTRLSVCRPSGGSARTVLQPHPRRVREHPLAVAVGRAGRSGRCAGASRPAIPQARRAVLAGVRAVGGCGVGRRPSGLRSRKKGGLKEAFDAEIIAEIEALVGAGAVDGLDFEAIETAARRRALQVAARAVERRLNADRSDHVGPSTRCSCGKEARYAGRPSKTFTTALGEMTLERAYYHCQSCEAGFFPRDRALGVEDASLSPAVTRMTGKTAAIVSFAESSELMHDLAGLAVDAKQVERTAEALGREIAKDERTVVEASPPSAPTMYLGMDGTGVPMRKEELEGREGKQADGTAKTREVKLVTVWTAQGCDPKTGLPMRDQGSVTYSAAIESAATRDTDETVSEFARRVDREARRRGFDQAGRRVVLGDGAPWIWKLADERFPGATQIVDLFHAKGHLWDVAKAIYGAGSDLGEQWAKRRRDELDEGNIDAILATLRVHAGANDAARKCVDYVTTNRHRLRYPEFRAQGLCTSTGVVEAGCKTAIGVRLKRAGMHWTLAGADAIIALRSCKLSGRFEDFWERRSAAATPTAR